jgi:purine nucleoside phosphorylase
MTESLPFASTLDVLARIVPEHLPKPRVGIVCGSGLSTLVSSLRDVFEVPYTMLEGFAQSTGKSTTHKQIIQSSLVNLCLGYRSRRPQEYSRFWSDGKW